jgi:hypothetical protein
MQGRVAIVLALALAACGGSEPPPAAPSDETLSRDTRAGRLAYLQERPEEAIAQYRAALARAQARDDITAIGDLGYNLAVAELRDRHNGRLNPAQGRKTQYRGMYKHMIITKSPA